MNPRAALTTYSLSRGAPSASLGTSPNCPTYIFLRLFLLNSQSMCNYNSLFLILSSTFSKTFQVFSPLLDKRREWDSNPRALADKRFSRPPRYDHFDISPSTAFRHFSAFSLSAQKVFYHQIYPMSIRILSFFHIFSKSQK